MRAGTAAGSAAGIGAPHATLEARPSASTALGVLAVLAVAAVGSRIVIASGITVGNVVALILLPLWFTVLRRYWGARIFAALGALASVAGLWLAQYASADHAVSSSATWGAVAMFTGIVTAVGVILWARDVIPVWLIGAAFGFGMLVSAAMSGYAASENPWKFGIGFPVMVIVLSLLCRPNQRVLEAIALLVFAAVALGTDSRYRFATLMIAAVLILWQMLPTFRTRRATTVSMLVLVAAITAITYNLATALIVEGYLGEQAQERTIAQIEESGSLILGGRPELAASVALFENRPMGYGAGVLPTLDDILVAKTGMASIGYQPNNGYVETYLFGGSFELHSVAGDLWASFGVAGLAFVICTLVITLRALGSGLATRSASAIVLFLAISTLWNTLFSPIYGSLPTLVLTVGLCLLPPGRAPTGPGSARGLGAATKS